MRRRDVLAGLVATLLLGLGYVGVIVGWSLAPTQRAPAPDACGADGCAAGSSPERLARTALGQTCQKDISLASFDGQGRYVRLSAQQLAEALRRNPFECDPRAPQAREVVIVPAARFSKSRQAYQFGGATADFGWPLMITRWMLTATPDLRAAQFPATWGHGCPVVPEAPNYGWTCFFREMTPSYCLRPTHERRFITFEEQSVRHQVKLFNLYDDAADPAKAQARNAQILRLAGLQDVLQPDNDVQTMRILFQWVFRLQNHTRAAVDRLKGPQYAALRNGRADTPPFLGFHIRWGDKVGRIGRIKESEMISLNTYVQAVRCYYDQQPRDVPRTVFVASDEFEAVQQLRELLGSGFNVVTSATPRERGFDVDVYHSGALDEGAKFDRLAALWADMELLAEAETFVGSLGSNVARIVHLMRIGKHPDSTLDAQLFASAGSRPVSCCNKPKISSRRTNCFWPCA